jgi:hypothetical protein
MRATLVNCVNSFQFVKLEEQLIDKELNYVITMRSVIDKQTGNLQTIDSKQVPDLTYKVYIQKNEKQKEY